MNLYEIRLWYDCHYYVKHIKATDEMSASRKLESLLNTNKEYRILSIKHVMITVEFLENKITTNRTKFINALVDAGYVREAISCYPDVELLRCSFEIYNDLWETFDKKAFESTLLLD